MARVTRRQAAAAAAQADGASDSTSLPAASTAISTTDIPKPLTTRKRPIKAAKVSDSATANGADDSQPDTSKTQAKKRKTAKGTAAKTAPASTQVNVKDEAEEDESPTQAPIAPEDNKTAETKQKVPLAEGGVANSKDLVVPVDSRARTDDRIASNFAVFIDPNGLIYDASLNQTNAGRNNNKFYIIQVNHLMSQNLLTTFVV